MKPPAPVTKIRFWLLITRILLTDWFLEVLDQLHPVLRTLAITLKPEPNPLPVA